MIFYNCWIRSTPFFKGVFCFCTIAEYNKFMSVKNYAVIVFCINLDIRDADI